jgi:integrase
LAGRRRCHHWQPRCAHRRPQRHNRPQPWLSRNELTDLLAAAEDAGADDYALVCLLGLNGLRVSEACGTDVTDIAGSRYQPTLRILGKGDKPAEVVLNPRTQQPWTEPSLTGPPVRCSATNGVAECSRTTPPPS